jgi:hypothetical protein
MALDVAYLGVINTALRTIGATPIQQLGAEGTTEDVLMSENALSLIRSVQAAHSWPSIQTDAQLAAVPGTLTLSSAAVGTGITATCGADFFTEQDVGALLWEVGADDPAGVSTITAVISATQVTVTTSVAWHAAVATAAGWRMEPLRLGYSYLYVAPDNLLTLHSLAGQDAHWIRSGRRILTGIVTETPPVIVYTRFEPNPDLWEVPLYDAIVARLAAAAALPVTKNTQIYSTQWNLFNGILNEAKAISQTQGRVASLRRTDLIDVR